MSKHLPLPYGNPEITPDLDVEILMRDVARPLVDRISSGVFHETDSPSMFFQTWSFPDSTIELVAECRVLQLAGDEFCPPSTELDKRVQVHIDVRMSEEEHSHWLMTELLSGDELDPGFAGMLRSGELWFHRFFTLNYDPIEDVILFVFRRSGFLDSSDEAIYDAQNDPWAEDRDDERVHEDEFSLLKAALARISH